MKDSQSTAKARWFKRRYELFSKYDEGIRVSEEMWFSVTPEEVAMTIAQRVKARWPKAKTVIDICGGAAGNAIAFARVGFNVIYIDIDPHVLQDAAHNAGVYGCRNIEFHLGDALKLNLVELADPQSTVVHASPEWGGPAYKNQEVFDVDKCGPPVGELSKTLLNQGFERIVMFLPRKSDLNQLTALKATALENIHVDRKRNPLAINAIWDINDESDSDSSSSAGSSSSDSDGDSDSDSAIAEGSSQHDHHMKKRVGSTSFSESSSKKHI